MSNELEVNLEVPELEGELGGGRYLNLITIDDNNPGVDRVYSSAKVEEENSKFSESIVEISDNIETVITDNFNIEKKAIQTLYKGGYFEVNETDGHTDYIENSAESDHIFHYDSSVYKINIIFFDESKTFLGQTSFIDINPIRIRQYITNPYITIEIRRKDGQNIVLNDAKIYEESTVINNLAYKKDIVKETIISVKADGTGDALNLKDAIDKVILPSKSNRYIIELEEGVYDLKWEYRNYWGQDDFIGCTVPPFTRLKGVGNRENVIITAEDDLIPESIRIKMATLNLYQTSELENLTVNGNGLKYTVHDDFQKDDYDIFTNEYRTIKNVVVKGDVPLTSSIYGAGLQNGTKTHFIDCVFSSSNKVALVYFHNATSLIEKSGHVIFENCRFKSYDTSFGDCRLYLSSVRSASNALVNRVTLKGTKVRTIYHTYEGSGADVIRWNVDGYANQIAEFGGSAPLTDYTSLIATEEYSRYSDGAY